MGLTEQRFLFVDTWGWLVLADRAHPLHRKVIEIRKRDSDRGVQWMTSDFILDEMITRLFQRTPFPKARVFCAGILGAGKDTSLRIERIDERRFEQAYELRLRFRDKPTISFTDFTSAVVMKECGVRHVLTGDTHFRQFGFGFALVPED